MSETVTNQFMTEQTISADYGGSGSFVDGVDTSAGDTVIGVSSDDVVFTPVPAGTTNNGSDAGGTATGPDLAFTVYADGTLGTTPVQSGQALVDEINANDGNSSPVTQTFYYQVQHSDGSVTVDSQTDELQDILISGGPDAPYGSPETVAGGSETAIPGLTIGKAPSTGQTTDPNTPFTVTVSDFDFAVQQGVGELAADNYAAPGGGGSVTTQDSGHQITIVGTLSEVNADLSTLEYLAGDTPAQDYLIVDAETGPEFNTNGIYGQIDVPCYTSGVLILTERGEVAVSSLKVGDRVVTCGGAVRPIIWISSRTVAALTARQAPIRITAGALAEAVPSRDLVVSPGHCLMIDDHLVAASLLVNGATVRREPAATVCYHHFELETHDVVFADGAPAETYLDTGNRSRLHTLDHSDVTLREVGAAASSCLPIARPGVLLTAIRERLAERSVALGHATTNDPDLHLLVDGVRLNCVARDARQYRFEIDAAAGRIEIASRSAVGGHMVSASQDARRLGVGLKRLVLSDAQTRLEVQHGHAAFAAGFHDDEAGLRWSDGAGLLPACLLAPFSGMVTVDVHIGGAMTYPLIAEHGLDEVDARAA